MAQVRLVDNGMTMSEIVDLNRRFGRAETYGSATWDLFIEDETQREYRSWLMSIKEEVYLAS